jgi:hypothetical protein
MATKKAQKPRGTYLRIGPAHEEPTLDDALEDIDRLSQTITAVEHTLKREIVALHEELAGIKERLGELERNDE